MMFPFRTSAIFRNRWVALMWAAGICFMASEIVDSVSGVADRGTKDKRSEQTQVRPSETSNDPVAAVLDESSPPIADRPVL